MTQQQMGYADDLATAISRHMLRSQMSDEWLAPALVTAYDPSTHKATCALQPSGKLTGYLDCPTPRLGQQHTITPGTQVIVGLVRGVPEAILSIHYSDLDPVPGGDGLVVEGDAFINGQVQTGAVHFFKVLGLPTASATWRGTVLLLAPTADGAAGTADGLYLCCQNADGTFSWVKIAGGV